MHPPDFRRRTGLAAAAGLLFLGALAACSSNEDTSGQGQAAASATNASSGSSVANGTVSAANDTSPTNRGSTTAKGSPGAGTAGTAATTGTVAVGDGRPLVTGPEETETTGGGGSAPESPTPPSPPDPTSATGPRQPEQLRVTVVDTFPHDPSAFTQGLVFHQGELYESTGLVGASSLRRVALQTGTVLASVSVAPPIFAEGLALVGDELIQLSWRSGTALVYGRADLQLRRQYRYDQEGWGLCHDGTVLFHSDGTATLRRRDPAAFTELSSVQVTDQGRLVTRLNELECVGGSVFANVWQSDAIARIDGATGEVTGWIDASSLVPNGGGSDDVLNGIAYDPGTDTFLLTGKRWAQLYRVTFGP